MKAKFLFTGLAIAVLSIRGFAQNLDEIVAKHIEAIGGKANWEKVKTLRYQSVMKAQGAEIKFTVVIIDNKAFRSDISVMGMNGFSILNNKEGWNYMPWAGQSKSEAMTEDDVKNSQDDLSLQDEFITYKALGKTLDYYGMDDIDGTECFKLKMTDKQGKESTFYIDPSNYLVIKKTVKVQSNGQESESSTFYSDYKTLPEGIVYPMSVFTGWQEQTTVKVEINPVVDETIFKPNK